MAIRQTETDQQRVEARLHGDQKPRGYKRVTLADPMLYICGICMMVLRRACQVECGHQFCLSCIQYFLQISETSECPACRTEGEVTKITPGNYHPDFTCRRKLARMKVKCENSDIGCTWQDEFAHLDDHLGMCEYAEVRCQSCEQVVIRRDLEQHTDLDCTGNDIITGPCMFGCEGLPQDVDIEAHNSDNSAKHMDMMFAAVENLRKFLIRVSRLASRLDQISGNTDAGQESDETADEYHECVENLKRMDHSTKTSTNMINIAFKEMQRVASRLVDLERKFQAEYMSIPDRGPSQKQEEMRELAEQLSNRASSHCGVLFWEIPNMEKNLREAQASTHVSMESPVFYSGQAGYALSARIYLDGDGTGTGSQMSLFVVVRKGQFDGMLRWPLNELIKFTLIDQSGKGEHHVYRFATDPHSSSFQKPRLTTNIASGCPHFLSLDSFRRRYQDFVVDDTMMLEIRLDRDADTMGEAFRAA